MNLIRHSSLHDAFADRATRRPPQIDLARDEWEEVGKTSSPADQPLDLSTFASFWAIVMVLFLVIVATPAIEAAAHHL